MEAKGHLNKDQCTDDAVADSLTNDPWSGFTSDLVTPPVFFGTSDSTPGFISTWV